MRLRVPAAVLAVMSLLGAAVAGAALASPAHRSQQPNSFEGTCRLYGDLVFAEPIGPTPRTTSFTDTARGTCSGKLNGAHHDSIPTTNAVNGWGTISCAGAVAHTSDVLTFARHYRIHIFTDSKFVLTQGLAHSWGAVSGESFEHVDLLPYTDQALLERCNAGQLNSARYQLDARTISPLVG
jgi:hypothetical protein